MDLIYFLEELQTIARNGLTYNRDIYDRERYERLLELVTKEYADVFELPARAIQERFSAELGHITPKVGADAAIFNAHGEILLMERTDGTGWCLPCGWLKPNEKPADAAVREVWEETGLEVKVDRLVGVFTRTASAQSGVHSMVAIVHLCSVVSGGLTLSHEGLDLRYWPLDEVPKWSYEHERKAEAAHKVWSSETYLPAISD